VLAEHETSNWVQNLRADAEVRVRIGSESFAAQARVLRPEEDGRLCREIQELSRRKYGWGDGLVVQLTRKGRR
jgi:deazaflavin-dependent oxidoreductase (nitroreductase family)